MAIAAHKTNIRSFEGMARWPFPSGRYAFSYWAAFIRFFNGFSACIAYVICVGDCFRPIFKEAYKRSPDNKAIRFLNTSGGNRLLTVLVWLFIMLPLTIPKHIDSLRYASTFAVSFLVYFSIVVFAHSCTHGLKDIEGHVRVNDLGGDVGSDEKVIYLFRTGNVLVGSIGVFMFAYTCQLAVYEIWWDMRPEIRTPRNFMWSALIGMLMTSFVFTLTAIFGYLDFGATIGSNSILLMYNPIKEPQIMVAYVGIVFKLCVSYALVGSTARNAIYYVIGWQKRFSEKASAVHENPQGEALKDTVEPHPRDESVNQIPTNEVSAISTEEDTTYIDNIPFLWHLIVVVVFSVVSLLCGLFIPTLHTVFGFGGAINGGFLGFIFPALFYMYAGGFSVEREGRFNYYIAYLLLICGVIGIVFGLAGTIYVSL
ncbi:unnamed protein product [Phytomonas sp. EM1]|nr:unnamed protein product [Phytomonas sp. EM1]|eukprot:CCW65178.1 unnamed protein product [Phytomonas sp. isolate EM1]